MVAAIIAVRAPAPERSHGTGQDRRLAEYPAPRPHAANLLSERASRTVRGQSLRT